MPRTIGLGVASGVVAALWLLAGCAARVTRAQSASVDAFYECRFEGRIAAHIELERVDVDGRIILGWVDNSSGIQEAVACWKDKMRAHGYPDALAQPTRLVPDRQ